jgi:hypothetical protein
MNFYFINSLEELSPGSFDVDEPDPQKSVMVGKTKGSVCIVPAFMFDRRGYRLGYGKGYYDRFLASFGGSLVGLAFGSAVGAVAGATGTTPPKPEPKPRPRYQICLETDDSSEPVVLCSEKSKFSANVYYLAPLLTALKKGGAKPEIWRRGQKCRLRSVSFVRF